MMHTSQIDRLFESDAVCRSMFQGVFSVDTLPPKPRLLVCNTDPSTKPGSHWIAINVDKNGRGEYFDSFGRGPQPIIEAYMNRHCRFWTFNNSQLQSVISGLCGFYCCFFCLLRSRRIDMINIVKHFTTDTGLNDSIVYSFICCNKW